MQYTVEVLRLYARVFEGEVAKPRQNRRNYVRGVAHIQNHGDVDERPDGWVGIPGSGKFIEGFALYLDDADRDVTLSYSGMMPDGSLGPAVTEGKFVGSRGKSIPLYGFKLNILKRASIIKQCVAWARFVDGYEVGPISAGQTCYAPSHAPLESLRVRLNST